MKHQNLFSPSYDPNNTEPETGITHDWQDYIDGPFFGPAYKCSKCGKKNNGWHLWKEDLLPVCTGIFAKLDCAASQVRLANQPAKGTG